MVARYLHGPHIPFKQPGEQLDDAKIKNNWLEIERWARRLEEQLGKFWSASLYADYRYEDGEVGTILLPDTYGLIAHETPRHTTNGEAAFDETNWPCVKLVCPWDGIYAVTFWLAAWPQEDVTPIGQVSVILKVSSDGFTQETIATFDGQRRQVELTITRVGMPIQAGGRIWLHGSNNTDAMLVFETAHLEATYLGPVGTLYDSKWFPA